MTEWKPRQGQPQRAAAFAFYTNSQTSCHIARAVERPHWLRRVLAWYFQIAGCALSLPLMPLRSPDPNDPLFENWSESALPDSAQE
ncbi:MAG: hypothetical protein ACYC67_22715 [Prosthecobacter sp.]|jgi:hypothetical protein